MPGARVNNPVPDEHAFLEFVKECFAQKRKTLRNNLRPRLGPRTDEIITAAGLPSDARAEQLTIPKFVMLFQLAK
jgi:16S rRNA A1518/A1519 N6-dimethyltransferase RsmA/KsgA/DIM1 with predicted DNA glycosylase/AP lyase activity